MKAKAPDIGTLVRHPSAYGYPTIYHRSTRGVEVGAGWLVRQASKEES